jgi:hypothetical protein
MPVKISTNGSATDVILSAGVTYAVDHGAKVINISFGGSSGSSTEAAAINYALSHGVVVVAAGNSGNSTGGDVNYPAAYPGVISCGAVDQTNTVASFSSTGPQLDLAAPGVNIVTWDPPAGGSMFASWSGTSFSSPLVAGVAALILSVNPSLTNTQVTGILEQTAQDFGAPGWDPYYGYGLVRADAAVAAAAGGSPTTTTSTTTSTTSTTVPTTTTTAPPSTTRFEETDPRLVYAGSWTSLFNSIYSGGSMKYAYTSGASVTISFTGTSLDWIAKTGPSYGKAQVTLDGGAPVLVDLYSPIFLYQMKVWSTGSLPSGNHTVKIQWTGQKNASATFNYNIDLDAVDVVGTLR